MKLITWAVMTVGFFSYGQVVTTVNGTVTVHAVPEFSVRVFGATGDAKMVSDGVLTGSSTTVTSASANFGVKDTGKEIWGLIPAGALVLAKTTIATVVSATTITVASAPAGTISNVRLVWGTDDTEALKAAAAAADAVQPKGRVVVPRGGYIITDAPFPQVYTEAGDAYTVTGDGSNHTFFYPAPGHALTNGYIFSRAVNVNRSAFRGFTIQGNDITYSASGGLIVAHLGSSTEYADVRICRLRNNAGNMVLMSCPGSYVRLERCHLEFSSGQGLAVMGHLTSAYDCYSGNHGGMALELYAGNVQWQGGVLDECGGPTCYMQAGSRLELLNALVYAGAGQTGVRVAGGTARMVQSEIRPWASHANVTGLRVDAGSTAQLMQTSLTGTGTGYGLHNDGTTEDGGGNHTNTKSGSGSITIPTL